MIKSRFLLPAIALFFVAATWVSCDNNDDDDIIKDTYTLSGPGSGAQEVPAVTTSATGNMTGSYDQSTKMLDYTITWTGLSSAPQAMHFHGPAPVGTNAPVMIPITSYTAAAAGTATGMATLTPAQDSALLAGLMYYNIHTPANPGGEIRGQVIVTAD